jgi:hypothetical protein
MAVTRKRACRIVSSRGQCQPRWRYAMPSATGYSGAQFSQVVACFLCCPACSRTGAAQGGPSQATNADSARVLATFPISGTQSYDLTILPPTRGKCAIEVRSLERNICFGCEGTRLAGSEPADRGRPSGALVWNRRPSRNRALGPRLEFGIRGEQCRHCRHAGYITGAVEYVPPG